MLVGEIMNYEELPREQLLKYGVQTLSDQQLLMILLRSGTRRMPVDELAASILALYPNLCGLPMATLSELLSLDGIGLTKACELKAICELSERMQERQTLRFGTIVSSQMIGKQMIKELSGINQERLIGIYLDTKNQVLKQQLLYIGTLNSSIAHPREIFYYAVRFAAAKFILVHNHPSGQPRPSQYDIKFTQRIIKCGEIFGIKCLDHLIVGAHQYVSLKEEQLI